MRPIIRCLLVAALISAIAPVLRAQNSGGAGLNFRNGATGSARATHWLDSFRATSRQAALLIIEAEATDLPGMRTLQSLGGNYRLVLLEPLAGKNIEVPKVSSVYPVTPMMKLATELRKVQKGSVEVMIATVPGTSPETVSSLITGAGGSIHPGPLKTIGYFEATVPANGIVALASSATVLHIGPKAEDQILNNESKRTLKANVAAAPVSNGGWNLKGDSITIGVGDNVPGLFHVDCLDRVINYNPFGYANHGQHVNGTAGGAGIMDPKGEGFAPHSILVDHLYNLVWQNTGAMRTAHNMTITNNSYANVVGDCAVAGRYDIYSQILDTIALQHPDVLHVFASGNDGYLTCNPYPAGYGTVTGGYQTAKNVLVVGNVDKGYFAASNTSRGPIRDGRLKPEVMAVGSSTYSTRSNDTYLTASGTSMAAPEIAGSAALIQERYKQTHNGAYPTSALTKALLMNGAMDVGRRGPDYEFGFGIADVMRSLRIMDSNRYVSGTISTGGTQTPVSINVPAGTGQLKVMLYWHDAPASTLATSQLINDLDLSVTNPASTSLLPLVLNPNPANVQDTARPGVDRLNNVEQVVVNNPASGTYVVNVSGHSIPMGPQTYTVVYDIIPAGLELTCPLAGESFKNGDPVIVTWNSTGGTNMHTVEFSSNNGATWTTLSSTSPANDRAYYWGPLSGINSAQCLFRVSRNGTSEQSTSGLFTVSDQPLVQLTPTQCPGYISMSWAAVPNATGYAVLRKVGPYMQTLQTQSGTSYTASGLAPDSLYYFAVQPMFGTVWGYRSMALRQRPNTGNCSGTISDNDLRLEAIVSPVSGRLNTSSALTANHTLQVAVRNLDDAAVSSFQVAYQINGGAWTTQTVAGIGAGASSTINFTGLNLAPPGIYTIRTAVTNLSATDPVTQNDTLSRTVRQLQNATFSLSPGFTDDFESAARIELRADSMGFTANEHWDFINSHDTGRMRTFVDSTIVIGGTRSISLDMVQNTAAAFNRLVGTFNMTGAVAGTDEIRLEFDYKMHGRTKVVDSNRVWVRGSDAQPWQRLLTYSQPGIPGDLKRSGSLSLSDAMIASGQVFTSSTQIAFGQFDTSVIAHNEYGNGLTLDNVRIYSVAGDAGITGISSPVRVSCGLGANTPVTISVTNGVTAALPLVYVCYQFNGGPIVKDSILNLAGKTTVPFTFFQTINTSASGAHSLKIWVQAAGDSYAVNDTVQNYTFRNQPLISSYPYLQDFENGDGFWFAEGQNSSWQFGTPAGVRIHKAASGTKAWKTSLAANHNDNERSYLYSPCFSLSGLTSPMLSFSMASEIEDCGTSTLCDGAWVEYSTNDTIWTKLGAAGQGTNWYSSNNFNVWNSQGGYRWKVASIPLPTGLSQPLRIRFVMYGDPGTSFEGLAIDDIHVFDRVNPLYSGGAVGPISQTVSSGGFTNYLSGGSIISQLNPGTGNPGTTDLRVYTHTNIINATSSQYFLPRNFVINTQNAPTDSVTTRLYIPDADVFTLVTATGCGHCSKPEDAYELGVTKYDNTNLSLENGSLSDNVGGQYEFIPSRRIRWVPYDAGYYAEFKVASFSELWFNNGGAGNAFPLPVSSLEFMARKISESSVLTTWLSHIDTQVSMYEVQRSENGVDFRTISKKTPLGNNAYEYTFIDLVGQVNARALYYRLHYTLTNGKTFYSPTRQIIWSGRSSDIVVSPNPTTDGTLQLDWSTQPGETLSVTITDIAGRHIRTISETATAYSNRSSLSIGDQPKGVYLLRATLNGEKFSFKVTRL